MDGIIWGFIAFIFGFYGVGIYIDLDQSIALYTRKRLKAFCFIAGFIVNIIGAFFVIIHG